MGIIQQSCNSHWNYFLALDADLEVLSRYIEFDTRNYDCFSLELARILLAAASEVDVVAKQLCIAITPGSKADNIMKYRDEICSARPRLAYFQAVAPRFALQLTPWQPWKKAQGRPSEMVDRLQQGQAPAKYPLLGRQPQECGQRRCRSACNGPLPAPERSSDCRVRSVSAGPPRPPAACVRLHGGRSRWESRVQVAVASRP